MLCSRKWLGPFEALLEMLLKVDFFESLGWLLALAG